REPALRGGFGCPSVLSHGHLVPGVQEDPGTGGGAGERVHGEDHRRGGPGAAFDRPVHLFGELVTGPVDAVVRVTQVVYVPQDTGAELGGAQSGEGEHEFGGFGRGHPWLITDTEHPQVGDDKGLPLFLEAGTGRFATYRTTEGRVEPVHGEATAVGEQVFLLVDECGQPIGRGAPGRARVSEVSAEGGPATQGVVHAGTDREQGMVSGAAVLGTGPQDLSVVTP